MINRIEEPCLRYLRYPALSHDLVYVDDQPDGDIKLKYCIDRDSEGGVAHVLAGDG